MSNYDEEYFEDEENEIEEEGTTRYFAKKLITEKDSIDATFKGQKVINASIEPQGVVKAIINEQTGTVEFEKYDPEWCGEISLNLEASDNDELNNQYINDYTVQFLVSNGSGAPMQLTQGMPEDIEFLSNEEEEDVEGGNSNGRGVVYISTNVTGKTINYTQYGRESKVSGPSGYKWLVSFQKRNWRSKVTLRKSSTSVGVIASGTRSTFRGYMVQGVATWCNNRTGRGKLVTQTITWKFK